MKRLIVLACFLCVLALPGAALADYYGCLVNQTGGVVTGSMEGFAGLFPFTIQGNDMFCQDLPSGDYTAKTNNGFWQGSFTVNPDNPIKYGDGKVYWLQYIKF